ncbi:MAG: molybdopterin-synthase adenylyltransferase MoeB [Methylophilaceae bacterium]|nr:molybdopterin-synthase adenylyltransferase MoeB [Methylophilaceae bacterium]
MNDHQLLRYSRHVLLPQVEYVGQEQLTKSHALIVGMGGLGSPVALYLAASGLGQLTICDFDIVDLSNLQRQIIHSTASIGMNKALSAQQAIGAINPEVQVRTMTQKSTLAEMETFVREADVVIDCSDNAATRYALNQICFSQKKPLVSGAAVRFEGQITVFDFRNASSPCYHCLFPDVGEEQDLRCADNGVFAPLVGMIGAAQAAEALKCLMQIGDCLQGRLMLLDALTAQWRTIKFVRDPACAVCG